MASSRSSKFDVDSSYLRQQLTIARNEIHNLRQQMRSLTNSHHKEVERITSLIENWKCPNCKNNVSSDIPKIQTSEEDGIILRPIGIVSSWFPEKRGTPRQPGICLNSQGKLTLATSVFTNPEHALEGLEEFSHMWILFYFHKNDSTHVHAKVSPPRLNGVRTGVFGTRSPHRPCPIGLSVVEIDKVEGPCVYFSGVDMVDGTPVLDIKPYIPQYDSPLYCDSMALRVMDGREADVDTTNVGSVSNIPDIDDTLTTSVERISISLQSDGNMGEREAPDGEEGIYDTLVATSSAQSERNSVSPSAQVRVPSWITQPVVHRLSVTFTSRARAQLEEIGRSTNTPDTATSSIESVLREDPRSVYLRERWGNQFYTFLICNLHVSCKFDDSAHVVTVFQVKSAGKMCECGQPEWQCSVHGEPC